MFRRVLSIFGVVNSSVSPCTYIYIYIYIKSRSHGEKRHRSRRELCPIKQFGFGSSFGVDAQVMAHDNAYSIVAGLQDRWNVLSTATHIFQPPFRYLSVYTYTRVYSGEQSDNLDFSDQCIARPYGLEGSLLSRPWTGACYGCPSRDLGARPAWPWTGHPLTLGVLPGPNPPLVVKTGGNMAWPSYITAFRFRARSFDATVTRVRQLKVNSFRLSSGGDACSRELLGGGEGKGGRWNRRTSSQGTKYRPVTIKAWIIYCGMSRVSYHSTSPSVRGGQRVSFLSFVMDPAGGDGDIFGDNSWEGKSVFMLDFGDLWQA